LKEPATNTDAPAGVLAGTVRWRVTCARANVAQRIDTSSVNMIVLDAAGGGSMGDEMGTFRVRVEIANPVRPADRRVLDSVLVDTGAEFSWFPASVMESLGIERVKVWRFRQADGTVLARWTGGVALRVIGIPTIDEVVFGEPGDLVLLGAHSLEGLNLRVDPLRKQLIDSGPAPAAVIA